MFSLKIPSQFNGHFSFPPSSSGSQRQSAGLSACCKVAPLLRAQVTNDGHLPQKGWHPPPLIKLRKFKEIVTSTKSQTQTQQVFLGLSKKMTSDRDWTKKAWHLCGWTTLTSFCQLHLRPAAAPFLSFNPTHKKCTQAR